MKENDIFYIKKALSLAKKGFGQTSPNPCVGAILVKNNKIIGQGYHKKAGKNHAEIAALKNCKKNPKNATLYLNLEPCCHHGKTPPCTDEIIKAGIKKVIIAAIDPNPLVNGKGIKQLEKAGIKVETGILQKEAKNLNQPYIKYIKTGLPFVTLKIATSLDGKIATKNGESKWITCLKSRKYVHKLRSQNDAILTGINTILSDNPHLGVRHVKGKDPIRIILDSKLRIPLNSKVLRDKNVLLVTTNACNKQKLQKLKAKNHKIKIFNKKIDLKKLLKYLGKEKITSVLIESGSEITGSFIDNKLVDKVYFFIAPKIIGGNKAKTAIGGQGISRIQNTVKVENWKVGTVGRDLLIIGLIKNSSVSSNI